MEVHGVHGASEVPHCSNQWLRSHAASGNLRKHMRHASLASVATRSHNKSHQTEGSKSSVSMEMNFLCKARILESRRQVFRFEPVCHSHRCGQNYLPTLGASGSSDLSGPLGPLGPGRNVVRSMLARAAPG